MTLIVSVPGLRALDSLNPFLIWIGAVQRITLLLNSTGRSSFLNPRDRTLYDVKPPVKQSPQTHTSHVLVGNWVEGTTSGAATDATVRFL